jgi:hypothetical protein
MLCYGCELQLGQRSRRHVDETRAWILIFDNVPPQRPAQPVVGRLRRGFYFICRIVHVEA